MDNFDSTWHVFSALVVFLVGLTLSTRIGRRFGVSDQKGVLIYLWHTGFCLGFMQLPGDCVYYYLSSLEPNVQFGFGSQFVIFLTSIFSYYLGFSYLGCFLVYNIIGYIGLIVFYGLLRRVTFNKSRRISRLALLSVFLPSVSFWSVAIGKDAISFLAVCLLLWSAVNSKKGFGYLIFAVVLMLLVRPHIAAVMLVAYTVSFIFDKRVSVVSRLGLGVVSVLLTTAMVPFVMKYVGLEDAQSSSDIDGFISQKQNNNLDGGSSLDISSMSLPMKLFTYLYRPLPFEANSITTFAASLDNIFIILISWLGIQALIKKRRPSVYVNRLFLWVYLFLTWVILAETTANLGIAVRQKWMFAPVLIFLILSILGTSNTKRVMRS